VPKGSTETPVTNNQSSLRNISEERLTSFISRRKPQIITQMMVLLLGCDKYMPGTLSFCTSKNATLLFAVL
jgi:hypothetical protein